MKISLKSTVKIAANGGLKTLFILLILISPRVQGSAFDQQIETRLVPANPDLEETVWQAEVAPNGPFDLISVHRIRGSIQPRAAMLYLPGTNMNGEINIHDENYNLWLFLARRGVVVYTLDYRTHAVPNDPVPTDLDFMRAWTVARFVDDAELALELIRRDAPDLPVFVGGFSRGVTYSYVLARRDDVSGLILLDGSFKRFLPTEFDRDKALERLDAGGSYGMVLSQSRGWDARTQMMMQAATNPQGPATGKFDSIGEQLSSTLYNAWGEGRLANPVDGVSRVDVLARLMVGYDRTFPAIQYVEAESIRAQSDDPDTSLDDHFGGIDVPVIYFGTANMGADSLMNGIFSASRSGSDDVTIHVLENHGHLDVLVGEGARTDVFQPVLDWMMARIPIRNPSQTR